MEMQFQKNAIGYLKTQVCQQQQQEQTQQIRLPDTMPDIGHVLGCWGQVLIRGKEWRNGSVGINGGVMAWVLYSPENNEKPYCVDAWIPFQMKWDVDDTERDGTIEVRAMLCHIDARMLSDRKLMVRANIGVELCAMVHEDAMLYAPEALPEDIQVLRQTYPMVLPTEAGERMFELDQQLEIPPDGARVETMIRYSAEPQLTEYKIVADKLVLRGEATVCALYMDEIGKIYRRTWQVPFSQYAQLEEEYLPDTQVSVCFALTQLEMEIKQPDMLALKLGFAAQYVVCPTREITVAEDMYSSSREVSFTAEPLMLPAVLDARQQSIQVEAAAPMGTVVDVSLCCQLPQTVRTESGAQTILEGSFQILYTDPDGMLCCSVEKWEKEWNCKVGDTAAYLLACAPMGVPGVGPEITSDLSLLEKTIAMTPLSMLTEAQTGEVIQPDPSRPSLILRRLGENSLWEIAKETGSTVDAICKANGKEAFNQDQLLLIPIL